MEPVDSNKYWTHNYANLAMWYAKQKEPAGKVETNAVGLRDEGTPEERKRGTQIDPKKADTSAFDQMESNNNNNNTVTPITDFYDYGADNKTPNSIRYRVWATNTTAKGNSTEIPGLDDSGVYYNELNYVDVLPEGLRTQHIWIPIQFIRKTISDKQSNGSFDTEQLKNVVGENKFAVSELMLYTAKEANWALTSADGRTDSGKVATYNLYEAMLNSLIKVDGDLSQAGSVLKDDGSDEPISGKNIKDYIFYVDASGNRTDNYADAVYYEIDVEKMFGTTKDGDILTPAKLDADSGGGYFLQNNLLAMVTA